MPRSTSGCPCSDTLGFEQAILVGAFAADSSAVIARAERVGDHFLRYPTQARFAGIAICAPVDGQDSQEAVLSHVGSILAATTAPIALYQLPQITGNEITPETFERLATISRIAYLKDSNGADRVAQHAQSRGDVIFLRGAEGSCAAAKAIIFGNGATMAGY